MTTLTFYDCFTLTADINPAEINKIDGEIRKCHERDFKKAITNIKAKLTAKLNKLTRPLVFKTKGVYRPLTETPGLKPWIIN